MDKIEARGKDLIACIAMDDFSEIWRLEEHDEWIMEEMFGIARYRISGIA